MTIVNHGFLARETVEAEARAFHDEIEVIEITENAPRSERVTLEMNYLETLYPSPRFPRPPAADGSGFGRTAYMLAYTLIAGDYPVLECNVEDPRDAGAAAGADLSARVAAVQRRRDWPTRITQAIVNQIQERVLGPAIQTTSGMGVPLPPGATFLLRVPLLQRLPLAWIAYGIWPVHLNRTVRATRAVS